MLLVLFHPLFFCNIIFFQWFSPFPKSAAKGGNKARSLPFPIGRGRQRVRLLSAESHLPLLETFHVNSALSLWWRSIAKWSHIMYCSRKWTRIYIKEFSSKIILTTNICYVQISRWKPIGKKREASKLITVSSRSIIRGNSGVNQSFYDYTSPIIQNLLETM